MTLNPQLLSHLPKNLIKEAVEHPLSSKRKLCIKAIKSLTNEDEGTIVKFLENIRFEVDQRLFKRID